MQIELKKRSVIEVYTFLGLKFISNSSTNRFLPIVWIICKGKNESKPIIPLEEVHTITLNLKDVWNKVWLAQ